MKPGFRVYIQDDRGTLTKVEQCASTVRATLDTPGILDLYPDLKQIDEDLLDACSVPITMTPADFESVISEGPICDDGYEFDSEQELCCEYCYDPLVLKHVCIDVLQSMGFCWCQIKLKDEI